MKAADLRAWEVDLRRREAALADARARLEGLLDMKVGDLTEALRIVARAFPDGLCFAPVHERLDDRATLH